MDKKISFCISRLEGCGEPSVSDEINLSNDKLAHKIGPDLNSCLVEQTWRTLGNRRVDSIGPFSKLGSFKSIAENLVQSA